jgi:hypothetical protein
MLSSAKIAVSISHLQVSKKKKGFHYVLYSLDLDPRNSNYQKHKRILNREKVGKH